MAANVESMAGFAGKQMFPDDAENSLDAKPDRPRESLWAWHFKVYERTTAARQADAALKLFECSTCKERFASQNGINQHAKRCQGTGVLAKNFFTPAGKPERGAGGGGGAGEADSDAEDEEEERLSL